MKFTKPIRTRKKRKEKIAIIGSGPAGLYAAGHLICEGYQVHVYEKLPEPGGLLIFGIPDFRMPKDKILEGIEELKTLGVKFLCGVEVGRDIDFEDIISKYDAVLIATGAWIGKLPKIPGINLEGVYTAIHYLTELQLYKRGYTEKKPEIGKTVAVIGGGDTAVDAARTCIREGAEKVYLIYRRSVEEMPAKKIEVENAVKEGVKIIWLTQPIKVIGYNRVEALELIKNKLGEPDSSGRRRPIPIPGTEYVLKCDTVIFASGEKASLPFSSQKHGIKLTEYGTIWVDEEGKTSRDGVFAAGDVVTGPSNIASAIKTAKKAVGGIMKYIENWL